MRKEKKYHYIYKTTNLLSGRYYIGMHSSNTLDDGYLGSGTYLTYSIKKYGKENFTREIVEFCKTRKELKSKEEEIVTLQEIAKKDCMNLRVGGLGGYVKSTDETIKRKRKEKQYHFIYKTTNLLSRKYYIGMHSTDNLYDGYLGSGKRLRYSINKYGNENHVREILEYCKTREELISRETEIINLNEIAKEECINLTVGGRGRPIGYGITDDTRKKMSKSHKGQPSGMKGKTHTKKTRKKISEGNKGRLLSEESRKKISIWNKQRWNDISDSDRRYMKSKFIHNVPHTDEAKQKMSKAHMGKELSEEHKQKISNANKNRSEETRRKISEGNKGKKTSDETKLKISKANSKPQKKITCPHCNKTGGTPNMKRYHFDNCKHKNNDRKSKLDI